MAGDVTLPERTKVSVPSTKSSSKILITRVWIVPLLVPARNPSSFFDREKSSDVAVTVTVIFDGRMANGATRISRDMLTELVAALSFTLTESCRNCTWNTECVCVCVCVGEGGRGVMVSKVKLKTVE